MKKIFRFTLCSALLALASCSNDDGPQQHIIDFEGEEWNSLSAVSYGEPYSSNVVSEGYEWRDGATSLSSRALVDYTYGAYIRVGTILSSYNTNDLDAHGDSTQDLYVYNSASQSLTEGGGYNGSDNFLVVIGSWDPSDDALPEIFFADGKARTIKGCVVNSTAYFLSIAQNGNYASAPLGEGDQITISATGYDSAGAKTATAETILARKGDYTTQWKSWDLSSLGQVAKVQFDITGGPMTEWGMSTPKYFAIDNIVIEE